MPDSDLHIFIVKPENQCIYGKQNQQRKKGKDNFKSHIQSSHPRKKAERLIDIEKRYQFRKMNQGRDDCRYDGYNQQKTPSENNGI